MKPSWETLKVLRWRANSGEPLRSLCAGSGLARIPGGFWAVADDLNHLIRIPDGESAGRGHRIFPGEPSIGLGGGRLVAFPSGSKNRRCRGSFFSAAAEGGA